MTTQTTQTVRQTTDEPSGFGAYSAAVSRPHDLSSLPEKQPANQSLDFTDADKLWLKNTGLTTSDPNSYHKLWETEKEKDADKHRRWSNTIHGRIGMRAVSRGIVGAAFYAGMHIHSNNALRGYRYDAGSPDNPEAKNFIQLVAKCIDMTAGKGIKGAVRIISGDEEKAIKAVTFAQTRNDGKGRSLGHQTVAVTAEFAAMSFGDYMTRYFLGLADPNSHSKWHDKDGKLDIPGGLKEVLYNTFRGITYAAGEDIAVAVPYVFFKRASSNLLNKHNPGYRFDADNGRSGGSFKTVETLNAATGKMDRHIVGDYITDGVANWVLDLSAYNVGTKMFRDGYSVVEQKVEDEKDRWRKGDHHILPTLDSQSFTPMSLYHSALHAINYVVRTTVKVSAYMIPAGMLYGVLRSSQNKTRALAIDATGERGFLVRDKIDPITGKVDAKALKPGSEASHEMDHLDDMEKVYWLHGKGARRYGNSPFTDDIHDAYKDTYYKNPANAKGAPWYNGIASAIAYFSHHVLGDNLIKLTTGTVRKTNAAFGRKIIPLDLDDPNTLKNIRKFGDVSACASATMTPYFMLKADWLSAEWDTERTDMAIDRTNKGIGELLQGAATFDLGKVKAGWGEFRAGLSEDMRTLMREPFTDPKREAMAQRARWNTDPEHRSNEAYQLSNYHRLPQHKATEKHGSTEHSFANESLRAKKITPDTFTQLKPRESWTNQEALRKFQETPAQGQSVH